MLLTDESERTRSSFPRLRSLRPWGMAALLTVLVVAEGCASLHHEPLERADQRRRPSSLIEPDAFAALPHGANRGQSIVLDVRDTEQYEAGHVAGAIRVDPDAWKKESLASDTGLGHDAYWRKKIGDLGVSGHNPVFIYDDGRMTEAARIWFIFQHFGVDQVAVVNGGYRALASLIESGKIPVSQSSTSPRTAQFQPAAGAVAPITLVERNRLVEAVETRRAQIFDARTPDEFSGHDLRNNARGGHLPSAINLPHAKLLDSEGRLRSEDQLAKLFREAGFQRGQPIITHCDGGGRASLAALAAQTAGYGPIMNYYLSFGDWAADSTCPVEGSTPRPAADFSHPK